MKNTQPKVSVIVPTYNRKDLLALCLDSLEKQSYPSSLYEVIVVDDGSTDGTHLFLSDYCAKNPATKYFSQNNAGTGAARNHGLTKAIGEIICFTDDDCMLETDWIKNIVEAYKDETIGGVGGRIIAYSTTEPLNAYSEKNKFFDQENLIRVFAIGANSSYRAKVLSSLQGFDEYFSYSEDVDLGIRVQLAGYKLAYAPLAIVYHNHRSTARGILKQVYSYSKGYSLLNKRYRSNFSPSIRIKYLVSRLARKTLTAPYKSVRRLMDGKRGFPAIEPFFDAAVIASELSGLAKETFSRRKYLGKTTEQKLDFISAADLPGGWGR